MSTYVIDSKQEAICLDVSDDDLERASGACDGSMPTLVGTYCFTCPAGQEMAN